MITADEDSVSTCVPPCGAGGATDACAVCTASFLAFRSSTRSVRCTFDRWAAAFRAASRRRRDIWTCDVSTSGGAFTSLTVSKFGRAKHCEPAQFQPLHKVARCRPLPGVIQQDCAEVRDRGGQTFRNGRRFNWPRHRPICDRTRKRVEQVHLRYVGFWNVSRRGTDSFVCTSAPEAAEPGVLGLAAMVA